MDPTAAPDTQPVRLHWELETTTPLEKTWEALSNTNRFNRTAELSFRFEEAPQADGTTKRTGRARRLGVIDLVWDELPFQYRSGEWFQVVRNMQKGPAVQLRTLCRLKATKEGTSLRYTVEIYPRHPVFRPIVALEAYTFTRPKLEKALYAILDELEGEQIRVDPLPPPLSPEADGRLKAGLARLKDEGFRDALDQFIRLAPLEAQDRILALRFAKAQGFEEERTIRGLLDAVRAGLLTLSWELLCPSCMGPKHQVSSLNDLTQKVHCPSCNIHYDGTFPDSLAVNFRPSEAIRSVNVEIECIGSPAAQRQVVAQDLLGAGREETFTLNFEEGSYRLRTWPPIDTAALEVHVDADREVAETIAEQDGFNPFRLGLLPGRGTLKITNALSRELKVIIERRQRPEGILTAGRLLELEGVQDLLPPEVLQPEMRSTTRRQVIVFAETLFRDADRLRALEEAASPYSPRHIRWGTRQLIASFDTFKDALNAARTLLTRSDLYCAISAGPVLEVRVGGEVVPMGRAMDEGMALLMASRPGLIAAHPALLDDPEAQKVIEGTDLIRIDPVAPDGQDAPISWLAG